MPPNLFLIVIDSLRADVVYGSHVSTPTLDGLIERGTSFTQCVATTTSTTPSFSSILTGCYPPRHGVRGLQGYRLSPEVKTLAETFAAAGYHTHAEVTGPLVPETGILRGFEDANHRQGYRVPFFNWRDGVIDKLRSYVEPWLLLLHIWEVHRPYRSPPDFAKRWDRAGYEAAVAATDRWLAPVLEAAGDALVVVTGDHGEEYPDSAWEHKLVRLARRSRRSLRLQRWAPALDERLASFATGHGFALHEHLVRVPLVLAGPGVPHVAVPDQVRHVDLLPTLAGLCGIAAPDGIDGRSLVPLMAGEALPEEPAYMEAVGVKLEGRRIEGARTPDWKLLRPGEGRPALYKLDGGGPPDEKHNLYGRYPEIARSLENFLDRVRAREAAAPSGMSDEEEAVVEQHLRDLGYL